MKRKGLWMMLAGLLALPAMAQSIGISEKAMQQLRESNNTTCYVNTKAPGVRKEYDSKYKGYVWRDSMGNFLCKDENMKPMSDMDQGVYFTGYNNNPDDPKVEKTNMNQIKKEWDKERGCYVWKDMFGNFLGRDKPSIDKMLEWCDKWEKDWMKKGGIPKKKLPKDSPVNNKTTKQNTTSNPFDDDDDIDLDDHGYGNLDDDDDIKVNPNGTTDWNNLDDLSPEQIRNLVITSDAQLAQAEAGLRQARAAIAQAASMGVNVGEYADLSALDYVEKAINEYKRARSKMGY